MGRRHVPGSQTMMHWESQHRLTRHGNSYKHNNPAKLSAISKCLGHPKIAWGSTIRVICRKERKLKQNGLSSQLREVSHDQWVGMRKKYGQWYTSLQVPWNLKHEGATSKDLLIFKGHVSFPGTSFVD